MITIVFYFGNSNKFTLNFSKDIELGLLYKISADIINVSDTNILYLILAGKIIGDGYDFSKKLTSLDILGLTDTLTCHIILKPENTDRLDGLIQHKYQVWSRTASHSEQSTGIPTRIRRNAINDPETVMSEFLGVFNIDLGTYEENLQRFRDVPVTLNEAQFQQYTEAIEHNSDSNDCFCGHEDSGWVKILRCGHQFHHTCIYRHLTSSHTRCPICNQDVRELLD